MGQIYTKLNQLVMNDVDAAADPTRPREKLETEFNTPASRLRLPDPRSATQHIDRTPIYAPFAKVGDLVGTPKTAKTAVPQARYLETDLDDVLTSGDAPLVANMTTSTPVPRKVIAPAPVAEEIIDSIIEQAMEQFSELRFSDTGVCEVMTSERSDSFVYSKPSPSDANRALLLTSSSSSGFGKVSYGEEVVADGTSYAEEVVIQPEDVEELSNIIDECAGDSLTGNWSGIGGPDRSIGTEGELSCQIPPDCSTSDILIIVDDSACHPQSDSLIVHNDSASFQQSSSMVVQSDSASICADSDSTFDLPESNVDDSIFVDSALVYRDDENLDANNTKNLMSTPQKLLLKNKNGPRTPLGDVSRNSPIIGQLQPKQLVAHDGKIWRNVQDERLKRGLDCENTPPHPTAFNSYPPEVVQSAPGKLRAKNVKKSGTKWANDSLVI